MSEKKKFINNLLTAFLAQGISLVLSLAMSLLVPRFLGLEQYSYWQLFIFYTGYVGFFHFGFCDGIYLRLGGQSWQQLNFPLLKRELQLFALSELLLALAVCACALAFCSNLLRLSIWVMTAFYMVVNNLVLYFGYIFQAVNETRLYSVSVMLDRIFVLLAIVLLLAGHADSFLPFILAYTLAKLMALLYCLYHGKEIWQASWGSYRLAWKDMQNSTAIGLNLTIANIASMLILGIGRMVIDANWGIETFGKISLSLSITNFFLVFIQQVSMVMFPALRRIERKRQRQLFEQLSQGLDLILPVILIAYIPVKLLLAWWLPQYEESLQYLALLLPLCLFDGKMQMLFNTYLKVLRKERLMRQLNLQACLLSALLCSLGAFVLHSLTAVVVGMLVSIIWRSMKAQMVLDKEMQLAFSTGALWEIAYTMLFMAAAWYLPSLWAFGISIIGYLLYLFVNRKAAQGIWQTALLSLRMRAI